MDKFKKQIPILVLILVFVFALLTVSRFFGIGTIRSAMRVGYIGSDSSPRQWSGSYALLNGSMRHTIRPQKEPMTYRVEVETKSGSISIAITDADKNILFEEENIQTGTFEVKLTGKSLVRIDAQNHKGSFSISPEQ